MVSKMLLKDHELWPYLSPLGVFSGDEEVEEDDEIQVAQFFHPSNPLPYLIMEDDDGEPFIHHFNTNFFPKSGTFVFGRDEISSALGSLRRSLLNYDPEKPNKSLASRSLYAYAKAAGLEEAPIFPPSEEPLFTLFSKQFPQNAVPANSWYYDPSYYFGFLVSLGPLGEFCLVSFSITQRLVGNGEPIFCPYHAKDYLGGDYPLDSAC